MTDSISRCELFNKLATIPAPPEANDFKAEVYKVIQQMETIDKWIPCSEKLPDRYKRVLTTSKKGMVRENFINAGGWSYDTYSVVAWMPLPAPWEGADDDAGY